MYFNISTANEKTQHCSQHETEPPGETEWARDNHQGKTIGGHPPVFNRTIPKHIQHENCVITIRSHTFTVHPAVPENLEIEAGASIRNMNVRGKRGNIVQVFLVVEYDCVPNVWEMAAGDLGHIPYTKE
ncbi:protein dd3-3-like [Plakobranchus ocellatus]|uniref:Protein dd3-3-like n=1 Tax=Plakobranchus ocellatus TaxID=259542 RepID=A0AAV4BQA8_9GAST|nr:protein dd3-3-like [Plakobranchus ocellatus]